MKAADISNEAFLDAIRTVHRVRWGGRPSWIGASRWDIGAVLSSHPEWCGEAEALDDELMTFPQKVILAKAKRLVRRGLIDGCTCGCRGDYEIRSEPPAPWAMPGTPHGQRPYTAVSNTETRWGPGVQLSPFA